MTKIYKHARRKYMQHIKTYLHFEGDELVHKLVLDFVFIKSDTQRQLLVSTFRSVGLESSFGFE